MSKRTITDDDLIDAYLAGKDGVTSPDEARGAARSAVALRRGRLTPEVLPLADEMAIGDAFNKGLDAFLRAQKRGSKR